MQRFEDLLKAVNELHSDFEKFYIKGQAAAGTRTRKGLSDLRRLAQEIRKEIQMVKAERKGQKP
jgi:hypothetical protein